MIERLAGIVLGTLICAAASAQSLDDRVREPERRVDMLTAENEGETTHGKLNRLKRAGQEATAYCAKQGKKMQVVRDVRRHGSPGYTATTTNLTFACTDK